MVGGELDLIVVADNDDCSLLSFSDALRAPSLTSNFSAAYNNIIIRKRKIRQAD